MHPVLELDEASENPHIRERGLLVDVEGMKQPGPVPRLSRTPGLIKRGSGIRGAGTREILGELGYSKENIENLFERSIVQ